MSISLQSSLPRESGRLLRTLEAAILRPNSFGWISEALVANRSKILISVAAFLGMLLSATAQTATPGTTSSANIDPALFAKANAGDAAAQVAIGEQFAQAGANEHYRDVAASDFKQAADWYRKAAEHNYIPAELHLAALYRDGGKGFDRDMAQAATWYRRAADQGDSTAQGTLGVLYSFGQGVPQNYVEAYFWLDLAASVSGPNQEKYAANRQMVGQHLTTDQVSDVEDRVAAWKAAHPRLGGMQ